MSLRFKFFVRVLFFMTNLSIKNVSKCFDKRPILTHISLDVNEGEFVCVLGQSGSGKTTLLRLIAGFEKIDGGEIILGNTVLSSPSHHIPTEKRDIGIVFQDHALWPHMTVFDNVAFPLSVRGESKSSIQTQVKNVLRDVSMEGFEAKYPHQLSGGEAQRIGLARALIQHPKIIVFDEPLASLDAMLRYELQAVIKRLHLEKGLTSLYITHDQNEAMRLSDRIAVLEKGAILQYDTPENLYRFPKSATIAHLMGQGVCLDVEILKTSENSIVVNLPGTSYAWPLSLPFADPKMLPKVDPVHFKEGERVTISLRPEHIKIHSQIYDNEHSFFECRVDECFFIAGSYHLNLIVQDNESLLLRTKNDHPFAVGGTVQCSLFSGSILSIS